MADIHFPGRVSCTIRRAGYEIIDESWDHNLFLGSWRLYYNESNGAQITAGDTCHLVNPHHIYLIPPWLTCRSACSGQVGHVHITFDPLGLIGEWSTKLIQQPIDLGHHQVLEQLCLQLRDQLDHDLASCLAEAACNLALVTWINQLSVKHQSALNQHLHGTNHISPALEFIEQHLNDNLQISTLASSCALSPDYFGRLFVQYVGITPARYVLDRRITVAADYLQRNELSVEQIAERCGFPNRNYFTRVFTKRMNCPPARYRKRYILDIQKKS